MWLYTCTHISYILYTYIDVLCIVQHQFNCYALLITTIYIYPPELYLDLAPRIFPFFFFSNFTGSVCIEVVSTGGGSVWHQNSRTRFSRLREMASSAI